MASEHEPTRIPINLLEAFDQEKPVVEQIKTALRVLAVARRALEASGIAVRWDTTLQVTEAGDSENPGINLDTVSVDEVADLVTRGRLEEVDEFGERINELVFGTQLPGTRMLTHLLKYVEARSHQLRTQGWDGQEL